MNNGYDDKKGRYEIKPVNLQTVDRAVRDYFDKDLVITVDTETTRKKVSIIFATGERWKLTRDNLRDENRNSYFASYFNQKNKYRQTAWTKSYGSRSSIHNCQNKHS